MFLRIVSGTYVLKKQILYLKKKTLNLS